MAAPETTAPPRRRLALGVLALVAVLAVVSVLSIVVGARSVGLGTVLEVLTGNGSGTSDHQVVDARLPRLFAGLLVGAGLGLSGAIMQGVTRNPLADPGLFGVNAGAAFAVVAAISWFGIDEPLRYVWFAFVGAALVAAAVYAVGSMGGGGATPVKITLAGAAVNAVLLSVTTAVLLTDSATFNQHRFWTVGSIAGRRGDLVAQLAPFILVGVVLALVAGRLLNVLALGDDVARGLGQRVGPARALAGAATILLCGAATAIAGPISFLGLLVPHVARRFTGQDQRWILPYSMLLAPILLLVSDVLGRVVAPPGEIQVGVVLAFVGAPFLMVLLRNRKLREL